MKLIDGNQLNLDLVELYNDTTNQAAKQALREAMRLVRLMPACEQPRDIPMPPHPDGDPHILACVGCGSGEYLTNWDGNRNDYCGQCGQKIDWSKEDEDAEKPDL